MAVTAMGTKLASRSVGYQASPLLEFGRFNPGLS